MPLIDVQHLSFAYRGHAVLSDVNLRLAPGEHLAVIGANASGKTTLGHWLSGRLRPGPGIASSGSVRLFGQPWEAYAPLESARRVQFVGQLPEQQITGLAASVAEEVAFGVRNLGLPEAQVHERTEHALRACGLQALAQADPFELSGGELQRLGIAAAMAMRPTLLILDEPGSNLDPTSRQALVHSLRQLQAHSTLLLLDVSVELALRLATRFALLHEGRLALFSDVDAWLRAAHRHGVLSGNPCAEAGLALREAQRVDAAATLPLSVDALAVELEASCHA
ncbi:ABC transporter ATP-binding protein [Pseudomonas entomophila]|uniref:energy-coupling factor ABC transporter ATP-binding protein n=1 Tax=Pseudomonas entomophila TaxID=312306 RepID=UPI0023D8670C|nr:ABC transporter ATP-binding protein [Pseudomonas entomophila]MDF0731396.1 ABC transporter ATP-binding protein [Pseudomonas entomophila]